MSFEAFDQKAVEAFQEEAQVDGVRQKLIKLLRIRKRSPSLKLQKR